MNPSPEKHPIIVAGCSIAGMLAALKLCDLGHHVILAGPLQEPVVDSGLASCLDAFNKDDSPHRHFLESEITGEFLADKNLLKDLCFEMPKIIPILERMGVRFLKTSEGFYKTFLGNDHSYPRLLQTQNGIYHDLIATLEAQVRHFEKEQKLERKKFWEVLSVINSETGCSGVVFEDRLTSKITTLPCKAVVTSTSPLTSFYNGRPQTHTALMTELASTGAILSNTEMVDFIVHEGANRQLLPFSLGGFSVDEIFQTKIAGVFACGEAISSFHGAKALSGNILASHIFSGFKTGERIHEYVQNKKETGISTLLFDEALEKELKKQQKILELSGPENPHLLFEELVKTMNLHSGPVKTESTAKQALEILSELEFRSERIGVLDTNPVLNNEVALIRALTSGLTLAKAMVLATLSRKETRGAFKRADFLQKNEALFSKPSFVKLTNTGPEVFWDI